MGRLLGARRFDPAVLMHWLQRSFWPLPAVAMLVAGGLGFLVPTLDSLSGGGIGIFTTSDLESARGLLETIATVTVSVAGIAFSVTVVALQLASQQLGPRVLRTFQTDRLNQATLAAFLGLFVYALIALGRLSTIELGDEVSSPNLTLTTGVTTAVVAFGMFAAFIQNTVVSLQASTVISRIAHEGSARLAGVYPASLGRDARGGSAPPAGAEGVPVRATRSGFLNEIPESLPSIAADCDAAVVQRIPIGEYVITGMTILEVYGGGREGKVADRASDLLEIGRERTLVQDVGFPLRQLADVALRALSPSLNDPTTAENAMGAVTEVLGDFARRDPVPVERGDGDGRLRFIALAPGFDDLVRLGFEQIRERAAEHSVLASRLRALLDALESVARDEGRSTQEIRRQRELLQTADGHS